MNKLLNILYETLDYSSGSLFSVDEALTPDDQLEKGEWLSSAKRAGAERVFFVGNNPVAVFASSNTSDSATHARLFNRHWSLARPRLLFLVTPGELTVHDLGKPPIPISQDGSAQETPDALEVLKDVSQVAKTLQDYHRNNLESGRVYEKKRFGDLKNRADQALIRDLKYVRNELIQHGLSGEKVRFAHGLIGRSIFIRYLEDRGIITEEYFQSIASNNSSWLNLLTSTQSFGVNMVESEPLYPRVLNNKTFTYALFKQLATDFNGDMFPGVDEEEQAVTQEHLSLIQSLLYADTGIQKSLFFYSYRFDIIPLDLISSIYEEFYHAGDGSSEKNRNARLHGAFYTPPALAEFVMSQVLTSDVLETSPRILDPACGSGIFLVEAFRRIVRYKTIQKGCSLSFSELRSILRDQISGIEINEEAARIAAFSLYLSMLHYLDPPSISNQLACGNRLPNLIACDNSSDNYFHSIHIKNAFDNALEIHFDKNIDVVIGNPPWGAGTQLDKESKFRQGVMLNWCRQNDKVIGDKEPSQAFLWRSLDFLRTGGICGMLVSYGVLLKHSTTTQAFRKKWLREISLQQVFNFTHVRKLFFNGACSPFLCTIFKKEEQSGKSFVRFWSAKSTSAIRSTQAVLFSKHDCSLLVNRDLSDKETWKINIWGGSRDFEFIQYLKNTAPPLESYISRSESGVGVKIAAKDKDAGELAGQPCIDNKSFTKYDELSFSPLPERIHRVGPLASYKGPRLLVQRGIAEKLEPKGHIVARYEEDDFCFTQSIYGLKLVDLNTSRYKVILGTLWSSLSRYFFFMTSVDWGLWHHEIRLDELLSFPTVLDEQHPATMKVISIVDELQKYKPTEQSLLQPNGTSRSTIDSHRRNLEQKLDRAVFELYGLNQSQIDLIRDCCEVSMPYFYNPNTSIGVYPVLGSSRIPSPKLFLIEEYIKTFARCWNPYLSEDEEMRADIHLGAHDNMVAVEFYPADKEDAWKLKPKKNSWGEVLELIGENSPVPMGCSQILLDGLVFVVSDDAIIIIKRNEYRLWTRSLAREDAVTALSKAMLSRERNS